MPNLATVGIPGGSLARLPVTSNELGRRRTSYRNGSIECGGAEGGGKGMRVEEPLSQHEGSLWRSALSGGPHFCTEGRGRKCPRDRAASQVSATVRSAQRADDGRV